ncbi:Ig-like domain repeat protein, partial [Patescibacteria group bacterium]|nr:Ig-like domain repeat protein [Patescibacteria group bacterium]
MSILSNVFKSKVEQSLKQSFFIIFAATFLMSGFFVATTASAAITTINLVSPDGGEEWRGTQNIVWSTDGTTGDQVEISYSTDNFTSIIVLVDTVAYNDSPYAWNTTLVPDGTSYKIRVKNVANSAQDQSILNFTVDNTPPTTTYAINPATPDGLNGWYITVPTITLTCGDGSGSGCNNTYYKWDGAGSYTTYLGPFSALEGEHTLSFYSDDKAVDKFGAHNVETAQTKTIKVDTTFPTVAVTSITANGSYNVPDAINATLTFSEAVSSTGTLTVALNSGGSCSVPILTNVTSGTCTYTIGAGDTSADLTVTSITPSAGVVEDVAGNDSTLLPTSNIANTSNIIIDTTAPLDFTVGTVAVTGGTVVSGWWNSTNTGVNVNVPVDNDASLIGGTIQLQAEADGTFENIGSAYTIIGADIISGSKILSLTDAEIEALVGFSDGDNLQFKAIITDLAGNVTTGTKSANNFNVDQTLPSVEAGTDKEVKALVSQNATISDSGSGLNTYTWSQIVGGGVITFSNQTGTTPIIDPDTNITATTEEVHTLQLIVTDIAGNSAFDTIQFAWDTTLPVVTQVTSISTPTNDTTPSYVFNVDSVKQLPASVGGGITYGGSCGSGAPSSAIAGVNTTTYGPLLNATYADCTIIVTDAAGNASVALAIPSFEIDTIVATVFSITTEDTDFNGSVDKATIVFNDEIKDSTFSEGDFTIDGTPATIFGAGVSNDDTVILIFGTQVAGTEAKTVAYTPGSATDLAGNPIAPFSILSIDAAKPVLVSAKTITTTTLEATFSEDLNGTTVNPSGNEFAVSGTIVTGADETAPGIVTLTYAPALGTGATPSATYTEVDTLKDLVAGNTAVTPTMVVASDGVPPILPIVSIISDNLSIIYAMEDDTITLSFTSSEAIATPTVIIQGASATTILVGGTSWTATRVMSVSDTQGPVAISIDFADSPAGNNGITVTATTDASSVFFDSVNPLVNAGTDKEVNAFVSQDATVSDPDPSSGGLIYAWTMVSGPGLITFGTPVTEDTTISADTDGTYVIRLTVTDNAGNATSDEITFIWDTTNPEPLTAFPSNGAIGVSISAGTATVTFDEPIVLLDSSRVLLVNDVTGTSYKGAVAIDGGNLAMLNIAYSGLNYGTKYRINVKPNAISDIATNKLSSNFISYFTTEIDIIPPVVNSFSAGSITTIGATLYVTTNENANCRYATIDSEYGSMTIFTTTGTASHYTAITGLTPSTGYDFYVRCADTSAQTNTMTTSAHVSFTTLSPAPDTTAPAVPAITTASATIDANTYTIAGTVADDGGARTIMLYNGLDVAGSATIPAGDTTWAILVPLMQDAGNSFTATATDVAGNTSAASTAVLITETTATGDITDPAIPA